MLSLTPVDNEEEPTGNFDLLLDFRPEDFKDFAGIAKQLDEFRTQTVALKQRWREVNNRVLSYRTEIAKIDEMERFLTSDEDWQTRVRELKDEYIKRVQYEKESQELETLEEQLGATDKITREFKVQVRQEFTCMLCYESDVKLFLDPCGHMTCTACWSKVAPITPETKKCPCCRTAVKAKKIYLV